MNTTLKSTRPKLASPWIYFLATFAWTWLIWGAGILMGITADSGEGLIVALLGVIGPMVTGIGFTYLTRDQEGRRDYWKRIVDFKRIPAKWYLVIFLFAPVLNILAALLDKLAGGSGAGWGETLMNAATNPFSLFMSFLFASFIPFIEELGWRGYVLDRLQEKYSALISSLILGVVWSLWHLPLFFVPGTYQAGLGVGTPAFWLFFAGIVPLTFVFTWIYNNTNRSTLAVILFHSMVNFTGELLTLSERADTYSILLWFVAAIGITVIWSSKTFTVCKEAYS